MRITINFNFSSSLTSKPPTRTPKTKGATTTLILLPIESQRNFSRYIGKLIRQLGCAKTKKTTLPFTLTPPFTPALRHFPSVLFCSFIIVSTFYLKNRFVASGYFFLAGGGLSFATVARSTRTTRLFTP